MEGYSDKPSNTNSIDFYVIITTCCHYVLAHVQSVYTRPYFNLMGLGMRLSVTMYMEVGKFPKSHILC